MFGCCAQCGGSVSANAEGRLPPWCPQCGGNVKADASRSAGRREDVVLRWQESKAPALELPAPDETLEGAIGRVQRSAGLESATRRQARLAGLGAVAAGSVFLAIAVGIVYVQGMAPGTSVQLKLPLLALIAGLGFMGCGLYSLATGTPTIDFNGDIAWDITVDRQGVQRAPAAGTVGLIDAQFYPWERIAWLEYEEDFTFGTGRSLVLVLADESRERIGLAAHVTSEAVFNTAAAFGKKLQVATPAIGRIQPQRGDGQ